MSSSRVRVAVLLGLVAVAYHYSLLSLAQSLGLETPLAYVGLVPVIALALAALRARPLKAEPPIHDRQVDYIVGLPLMAAALAVNALLPKRLSTLFWVARLDLFTLPLFVAGAVAVLFGVRVLWRQRVAVGFLFLAWPLPYSVLLLRFLNGFTGLTLAGLRLALRVVHVAEPLPSADGSLFQVQHKPPFPISVVSACSGVNGMVGFLIVGLALTAVVQGPRMRKGLWLGGGLLLLWLVNIGRILAILWAGKTWGEKVAIDVLHPYAGLVTFNLGVGALLLVMRPLGLSIVRGREAADDEASQRTVPRAVPRAAAAVAVVALIGVSLSSINSGLRSYDLVADAVGAPRLWSFSDHPFAPDGWRPLRSAEYTWAKPYFGEKSTWLRYQYRLLPKAVSAFSAGLPVVADVISTTDVRTFSAYGIEACYRFHGYRLGSVANVALHGGVTGQVLSYVNAKAGQAWTVVYWIWPVKSFAGTRYERVVLYSQNSAGGAGGARPEDLRPYLVSFAKAVVAGQRTVPEGSRLVVVPPKPRPGR